MDLIKEEAIKSSFQKVKEDILSLKKEIELLNHSIESINNTINNFVFRNNTNLIFRQNNQTDTSTDRQSDRHFDTSTHIKTQNPTEKYENSTVRQINSTDNMIPTDNSTDKLPNKDFKEQNIGISIRNEGVSTDRQTIRQTDTSTGNQGVKAQINLSNNTLNSSLLLSQLNSFQKDIRIKVKKLTNQEMIVFSSIYQLDSQGFIVDYSLLSSKLNLTESSIRDYIQRIISKGFPLAKEKINNKKVVLHISQDFKQLISLDTLLKLRDF
ncbi:MAG TPA: hypothetical protein P5277_03550 [Candidatus Paceibacterota bacterium]|nr:hypothetical protein [Candidatus Paceibacterota bacterium]